MSLALLSLLLAAAPVELSYGTGTLELQKLAAVADATLSQQVLACLKGYGVTRLDRRGASAPVWSPGDAVIGETSRAERVALLSVVGRKLVGSEIDVLVPSADGDVPVTVTWEPDGVVTFEAGPAVKSLLDETMTLEKLKARVPVGAFTELDAKWDGASLSLVEQALATLTKDELALVTGLGFRRARADGIHRAKYERGDESNWVNVYDSAFAFSREMFTGSPQSPRADGLLTVVHELGHALADVRFREKGVLSKAAADEYKQRLPEVDAAAAAFNEKAQKLGPNPTGKGAAELKALDAALTAAKAQNEARFQKANAAVQQMLANDRANAAGRPVEKAFAGVLEAKKSPTRYGRTNVKEHFAECFSLSKLDPAALRRVSGPAAAWFDAAQHVAIAGKSLDP